MLYNFAFGINGIICDYFVIFEELFVRLLRYFNGFLFLAIDNHESLKSREHTGPIP